MSNPFTVSRRNILRSAGVGFGGAQRTAGIDCRESRRAGVEQQQSIGAQASPTSRQSEANHLSVYGRCDIKRRYF